MPSRTTVQIAANTADEIFTAVKSRVSYSSNTHITLSALIFYDDQLRIYGAGARFFIRDDSGQERRCDPFATFDDPVLKTCSQFSQRAENEALRSFTVNQKMDKIIQSIIQHSYYENRSQVIRVALSHYRDVTVLDERYEIVVRDREGRGRYYNPHMPMTAQGFEITNGCLTFSPIAPPATPSAKVIVAGEEKNIA